MERTRDQLIRFLRERDSCSAPELADAIGVGQGAIRRHLDIMAAEGLLHTRLERQPRGRPVTRYSLSEAGEERSAAASYSRLLDRLYPALAQLSPEAVAGQPGEKVIERLFDRLAEDMASEYAPRVRGADLGTRVEQVIAVLSDEGILDGMTDEGSSYRLSNSCCPYRSAAKGTRAACAADRRTIELLVGAPVSQVMTIVDGGECCEYVVVKEGMGGSSG